MMMEWDIIFYSSAQNVLFQSCIMAMKDGTFSEISHQWKSKVILLSNDNQ